MKAKIIGENLPKKRKLELNLEKREWHMQKPGGKAFSAREEGHLDTEERIHRKHLQDIMK